MAFQAADSVRIMGYLMTPRALAIGPRIQSTFAKAYKARVNIAFTTDPGYFFE